MPSQKSHNSESRENRDIREEFADIAVLEVGHEKQEFATILAGLHALGECVESVPLYNTQVLVHEKAGRPVEAS
jgi:hypothetical protein